VDIKNPHKGPILPNKIGRIPKRLKRFRLVRWLKRLLVLASIPALIFVGFYFGIKANTGRGYEPEVLLDKMADRFNLPTFSDGSRGFVTDIQSVKLNIKHENIAQIRFERLQALEGNKDFTYVTGRIDFEGQDIPIKLRLKGDRVVHWNDPEKMSFRVKIKGDNAFMGMKRFSLQKPRVKNYVYEWLYHKVLKREGLLGLQYKFIDLDLNGTNLGTYAIEEHFDKRLLEKNGYREGPIIRLVEGQNFTLKTAPIEPYDGASWSSKKAQVDHAIALLDGWRNDQISTSQCFDSKKMAKYFAVADLLGAEHSAIWKSVKFYFNPVTGKLEPVGVDAQLRFGYNCVSSEFGLRPDVGYISNYKEWYDKFFVDEATFDPVFFKDYMEAFERMSKTVYLDSLFNEVGSELDQNMALINRDFPVLADHINNYGPDFFRFNKNAFYGKQRYMRNLLTAPNGIRSLLNHSNGNTVWLDIANTGSLPMEINRIMIYDSIKLNVIKSNRIPGRAITDAMEFQSVQIQVPDNLVWADSLIEFVSVGYNVLSSTYKNKVYTIPWNSNSLKEKSFVMQQDSLNMNQPYILLDSTTSNIYIQQGTWTIDKPLVFPKGYAVHLKDSTTIDLVNGAKLIFHGPIFIEGSVENPVLFNSSSSTGQGILVLGADRKSVVNHCVFSNLSYLSEGGWSVPGAINFYESPVDITNSAFVNNRSEDGLNIVRTNFTLTSSLFSGTQSDAFDGDFVTGTIKDCYFKNLGNDGIDVSGSVLTLERILIQAAGDKGISAGEDSDITANAIIVEHSEIAVAAKDLSSVQINNLTIDSCSIGFTAFQKKPEFGPASITATNVLYKEVIRNCLNEKGSEVFINGKAMQPSKDKVEDVLYGAQFGKKTIK
jgi:hypothetical protein